MTYLVSYYLDHDLVRRVVVVAANEAEALVTVTGEEPWCRAPNRRVEVRRVAEVGDQTEEG